MNRVPLIGRRIVRLATTGSTMDDAAALAAAGEPEGTVVVAAEQTAGRGRAGRRWQAPPNSSILCSALLRPPVPPARLSTLPLILGVAVAETLELGGGVVCGLKWPNDVWIGDRKVAGVLLAARSAQNHVEYATVGIGINVNLAASMLPSQATSLMAATGRDHDLEQLLRLLLTRLDVHYRQFVAADGSPPLDAWRARDALHGEAVTVRIGGIEKCGVLRGVADDGSLVLEGDDGTVERVVSGDVVRGPVRTGARRTDRRSTSDQGRS